MATKKQTPPKKRAVKNPPFLEPARTVPMTEEQCRKAAEIMADLIDSYIARHRDDPPRDRDTGPGGEGVAYGDVPPLAEHQDLLARAIAIWLARPDPRTYYQGQAKAADAQIRKNNQALDRYLRGFETGALPEELLADRVQELKSATAALRNHKKELAALLDSTTVDQDIDCLQGVSLAEFLQDVFDAHADLPAVKSLLRLLVEEMVIEGRNVRLVFRIPPAPPAPAPVATAAGEDRASLRLLADSLWGRARWVLRERTPAWIVAARSSERSERLSDMDLSDALDFASTNQWSVLTTIRRNGRPQLSNVGHLVCADGLIRISVTADRAKYHNLVRDPWAALHVTRDDFFAYAVIEGDVELSPVAARPDDPTVDELVEHYQGLIGDHEDWDAYRAAMVTEHRAVIRLNPTRSYGMLQLPPPSGS